MKRPRMLSWVAMVVLLSSVIFALPVAHARAGGLTFREVKITGDEFVVLQNNGDDISNLSAYWLGYSGSDSSTAPPVQELPNVSLVSGGVILLSSGGTVNTCDALIVSELSPSLSDSKGTLQLWLQTGNDFSLAANDGSQVKWSKSTSSYSVPAGELDLKSETAQYTNPAWYFDGSTWRLANVSGCNLITYASSSDVSGTVAAVWPLNNTSPPAIIQSLTSETNSSVSSMPSGDIGLKAPQISELLPNPSGTGTDDSDEFIELYNPNSAAFDLNGFILETGISTKHKYTFTDGVSIPGKSFTAFYSADTGLTLSNTTSQASLLDPLGNLVSQSDAYNSAKDGMAWALANGKWYWTSQPTPGLSNVVRQSASGASSKVNKTSTSRGSVKGASTGGASPSTANLNNTAAPTPIHPWTLAGVGLAALLYASYEYKADLANNFYRLKRYYAARRAAGK